MQRPRILLADDDVSIRTAITRLLSDSYDVVGHVDDAATLLDSVPRLRPDVVVLDFSLPGGLTSMEVCRRLTTSSPGVAVVALTGHDDPEFRRRMYAAGASGYVWKLEAAAELVSTIEAVVGGGARRGERDTT